MKKILKDIQNGKFAKEWVDAYNREKVKGRSGSTWNSLKLTRLSRSA